jgi:hypothetical protein
VADDAGELRAVREERRSARQRDLALKARRRAIELEAAAHGVGTAVEREALEAVYAYERALSMKRSRKFHA